MNRRGFLGALLAAPAIIRTPGLLMAVKPVAQTVFIRYLPLPALKFQNARVPYDLNEASLIRAWTEIHQFRMEAAAKVMPPGPFDAPRMTAPARLQPYIVAEHRRANGMAGVNLDGVDALEDSDLLAYARAEIERLRAPGQRGVLAENDHESKIRCQALERMVVRYEESL